MASNGMGALFKVTQVPPRTVGSGVPEELTLAARFFPKIEIKPPGASPASSFTACGRLK